MGKAFIAKPKGIRFKNQVSLQKNIPLKDLSVVIAKKFNGRIHEVNTKTATIQIGSRLKWFFLGLGVGGYDETRIPITIKLVVVERDVYSFEIAFSPGTPDLLIVKKVVVAIEKRINGISEEIQKV